MPDGALPPLFPPDSAGARNTPAQDDPLWAEDGADDLGAARGIALSTVISAAIWLCLTVAYNWLFGR